MGMAAVFALALWFAGTVGFSDSVACSVQGYVNVESGQGLVFTRVDTCLTISERIEDNKLLLWSPHRWAVVNLPLDTAQGRILSYRWGAPSAYLDEQAL